MQAASAERQQRPSAGAAVGVFANGLYPLFNLGLRKAVDEAGSDFAALTLWGSDGGRLNGCSNPAWSNDLQTHAKYVERTKLRALLLDAVRERGGEIRWEKQARAYETLDTGATTIGFEDQSTTTVDLLVGADGGFSSVRRHLLHKRDPATADGRWLPDFAHQTGFYAISHGFPQPDDDISSATHAIWLHPGVLSSSPLPGGKIRWDLILPEKEAPPPAQQDSLAPRHGWEAALLPSAYSHDSSVEILNRYRSAYHPVAGTFGQLLDNAERIIRSPLRQMVWKADEIQCGNAVLIGDAARLMLPSSGQGESTALKSALCSGVRDIRDTDNVFMLGRDGLWNRGRHRARRPASGARRGFRGRQRP